MLSVDPDNLLPSITKEEDDFDNEDNLVENPNLKMYSPTQISYYRRFMNKDDRAKRVSQNEMV